MSPLSTTAHLPSNASQRWQQRIRDTSRNMLRGLVPGDSAISMAQTDAQLDNAHFEEAVCRNCGMVRTEPHCGACGQAAVRRFSLRDVWEEFWQTFRLFELPFLHAGLRLARSPGLVAREYVLGARKRHVHPLKLLLFAVGLLLLVLERTGYLTAGQTQLSAQMQQVVAWSRWSFSLGLFAALGASRLLFQRRLHYNLTEHLVLALYLQFVVVAANLINLLPLLLLDAGHWAVPWRVATEWYMTPVELAIVGVAWMQFFRLRWRSHGVRIALGLLLFWLLKKGLLFAYGRLIVWVVQSHIS